MKSVIWVLVALLVVAIGLGLVGSPTLREAVNVCAMLLGFVVMVVACVVGALATAPVEHPEKPVRLDVMA